MKIKKTETNVSIFFSFYIAFFFCLLISFFASAYCNLNYNVKNIGSYLSSNKKSASYTLDDMALTNYTSNGSSITSTTDDGQIKFNVGRYIYDFHILLDEKVNEAKVVTVYYAETKEGFSEENKISFTIPSWEDSADIMLNCYAEELRVDIGSAANETYKLNNITINNNSMLTSADFWTLMICFFVVIFFISLHFILDIHKMYSFIYKWRFAVGAAIVLFGVILNLNGSSIACWNNFVPAHDSNTILGEPRPIRSDEYGTFTSFSISQGYGDNSYNWFSDIIRGTKTDTVIVYGQPVKHILSILFRPFLTGFLVFGAGRGLAFFWWGRFVCLWLVTFELSMLITDKKKLLSAFGATICALAPVVQWWFAINGLAEMMIFGGLAVLMLHRFMNDKVFWHRLICLFVLYCCAGGYIMTFYPAWMIPLAYAYLALVIWVIITNFKNCHLRWYDFLSITGVLLLFGASMIYIYSKSGDTINLVLNTAYPGKRIVTGGGDLKGFFRSFGNFFFTFQQEGIPSNVCEASTFWDFFPLGIIGGIFVMLRYKKKDWLIILLLIFETILGIYIIFGLPEIAAKITLLSMSMSKRALVGAGFINILLLLRTLSLYRKEPDNKHLYLISVLYTIYILLGSHIAYGNYLNKLNYIILAALAFAAVYSILKNKSHPCYIVVYSVFILYCSTAFVNPLQRGTANVTETELAKAIQSISEKDSNGKWIVDSMTYPMTNYTIMQGAPTINSTSTYPALDRWAKFDKEGKYEEIYNRYAHITIDMIPVEYKPENKFELYSPDAFRVYLNADELYNIDVRYIFTNRDLSSYGSERTSITLLDTKQGYNIYKLASSL